MGGREVAERGLRTGEEICMIHAKEVKKARGKKCIVDSTRTELDGRSTGTGAIGN